MSSCLGAWDRPRFFIVVLPVPSIYTRQKKKRNSKIFPLSFPFNAKALIVIQYLVLIKSRQNLSVA